MKNVRKNWLQCEGRANKGKGIGGKMRPTFMWVVIKYGVEPGILIRTLREVCSAGRMIQCQSSKESTGQWVHQLALPSFLRERSVVLVSVGGSLRGKGARVPQFASLLS